MAKLSFVKRYRSGKTRKRKQSTAGKWCVCVKHLALVEVSYSGG